MSPVSVTQAGCPLCETPAGELLWQDAEMRVVLAGEPDYPGFTRVIWKAHVAEMTDLPDAARERLMRVVYRIEAVQRAHLAPDKINLASLGNMVPHLHWHVIPRWRDDRHFPQAVWGVSAGRDDQAAARRVQILGLLDGYRSALVKALG